MTTTAIANNFKICQSFLGAKIHDPKDPGADLSSMLFQVVSAAFDLMETYPEVWKGVTGSEAVPTYGFEYAVGLEPLSVNLDRMIERFRLGVRELSGIWKDFLATDITDFLIKAEKVSTEDFYIPQEIWTDIIYCFAVAYHKKDINREHLLKSLTPLYIGRTASFVKETWDSDMWEVEKKIEQLCEIYEARKPFLIDNWQ
jgi:hypothetical protein